MARLSGTWTLTAIAKLAAWDQRLIITGSLNADGTHPMVVGTVIPDIRGTDFEVKSQARNAATGQWLDSAQIDLMSWDPVKGVVVTIAADDHTAAPDLDFDDLIVECVSSDRELTPPPFNNPRLDLTIPEKYVRVKKKIKRPYKQGLNPRPNKKLKFPPNG